MNRHATRKRRVRDIGRQKRNEAEFVEIARHEFRTRLTAITGSLGLLIGGAAGSLPASAMRFLQIAHDNGQRLVVLINETLDTEEAPTGPAAINAGCGPAPFRAVAGRLPRVLHVDDDRDVLHVVAEALRGDAEIVSACSLSEARQALAAGDIDLAVLDRTLADGDGLELLTELRKNGRQTIPAIVFSGHDGSRYTDERVAAVLTKSGGALEQLRGILRQIGAGRRGSGSAAAASSREVA